ncbi:hypothetical protein KI688_005878 [Linnemannia hyalina]|uniref:Uncharacterized protein n=1 Tax=Linnemannia hyalina TaxID=64524 RepID=A0A9P8BX77_9FUNG|nr:hypothetical protein KI688_005878 [Linnemannia hyalina]
MLDRVAKNPTKYAETVELKHVLKQTVIYRASLGLPWSLRGEEPILVESALSRLRIAADKTAAEETISTITGEPFKQLKQELFSVPNAAEHRRTTKLKTLIPLFEPVTFLKRFFEHPATIVGWENCELGVLNKETLTMGDFFEAHYEHGSRRGNSIVKLLRDITPGAVEEARLAVHETRIKAFLPNLAKYCPGGKYLSLIYAYREIVKTSREGWSSGNLWDSEPEIGEDHNHVVKDSDMPLMQLLMIIDGSNIGKAKGRHRHRFRAKERKPVPEILKVKDFPVINGGDKIKTLRGLMEHTPQNQVPNIMLEKAFKAWHD